MTIIPSLVFPSSAPLSALRPQSAQQRLFAVTRRQLPCQSVKVWVSTQLTQVGGSFSIELWIEVIRSVAVKDVALYAHTQTHTHLLKQNTLLET